MNWHRVVEDGDFFRGDFDISPIFMAQVWNTAALLRAGFCSGSFFNPASVFLLGLSEMLPGAAEKLLLFLLPGWDTERAGMKKTITNVDVEETPLLQNCGEQNFLPAIFQWQCST